MNEQYTDKFENIYQAVPPGKMFRICYDNVTDQFRLIAKSQDCFNEIREAFSVENTSAFFSKQYGYKSAARLYQINKFGYFSSGLIFEILNWIKNHYGDLSFVVMSKNCIAYVNDFLTPLKVQLNGKSIEIENISDKTGRNETAKSENKPLFKFRDYQKQSVVSLLKVGYGRGIIEIPTSGGKSFIIANFIWNVNKLIDSKLKTLIFVPNTQLVEQFYKDLIDYGYPQQCLAKFTGSMTAKQRKTQDLANAKIIIANRQYLFSNIKSLPKFDVLVVDEVHTSTAKASMEFISHCQAKIRIGCTGTLPKAMNELWNIYGMFGKVVYKQNVTDLQSQGYISKLKITVLNILHREVEGNRNCLFNMRSYNKFKPDEFGNSDVLFNDAYNAENEFCMKRYEELYSPVMDYLNTLDENILVLFDRVETGKNLFELAKQKVQTKTAHYIDGSTEVSLREDVRQQFETSGNNILIGNVSILGTGINIKRLKHVVFVASTKSFSRVIQSVGRILRLHSTKDEAHLIDIVMNFKYSQRHYAERLKYYKEVYGKSQPDEIIDMQI